MRPALALQVDIALDSIALTSQAPPLICFIVHCPPELLNLGFPYHAVPVSGWQYAFCDAVSLDDVAQTGLDTSEPVLAPANPRRWVAAAFGLLDRLPVAEARAEFARFFEEALSQVS